MKYIIPAGTVFCLMFIIIFGSPVNALAKKRIVSEARSVMDGIQHHGKHLGEELNEFYRQFSGYTSQLVKLEAAMEELKEKGYIGSTYELSPEKYERIYAEYAFYMAKIKNLFKEFAPRIQGTVSAFNKSIYTGRDRVQELRSSDLAAVEAKKKMSQDALKNLKKERMDLEKNCSRDAQNQSISCRQAWTEYERKLNAMTIQVTRLKSMKKMADIRQSITEKLSRILDRFGDKEAQTVATLLNYTASFESYASFIGSNNLSGMLRSIRALGELNHQIQDLERWEKGMGVMVSETASLVDERVNSFMKKAGMIDLAVESRSDVLRQYEGREDQLDQMLKELSVSE